MEFGPIHPGHLEITDGQFFVPIDTLDRLCPNDYPEVDDIVWVRMSPSKKAHPVAFEIAGICIDCWWLLKVDWLDEKELANRWEDRRHALATKAA